MPLSMYQISVPRFIHTLGNLSTILDKAIAQAATRKVDTAVFAASRLYPDMLPLTSQVQIACDTAKGAAGRLAAVEIPPFEDGEKNLEDLKARIAKTIGFLNSIDASKFDGSEDREIVLRRGDKETRYGGTQFLLGHAIPNFYFHVATAYDLLRHNGIEIGKRDFLGTV